MQALEKQYADMCAEVGSEDDGASRAMRTFVHFAFEADLELKQSRARWPDTEASLEAMARAFLFLANIDYRG